MGVLYAIAIAIASCDSLLVMSKLRCTYLIDAELFAD